MSYLLAASLLWAFSFGLIKGHLTGLDPVTVSTVRLLLAFAVFLPVVVRRPLGRPQALRAFFLGMLQFGLMYILYITSYRWLPAWMVALFTIFTPLYVVLFSDLLARRFRPLHLAAALMAIGGAAVVVVSAWPAGADWRGIVLLQLANLCFAAGQVLFVGLKSRGPGEEAPLLGWMYLGAAVCTLTVLVLKMAGGADPVAGWHDRAWLVLLYLGVLPTGLGFYLWNKGASRVGPGTLAAANNLKIPLAVLVSWLVFGEEAAYWRVLLGLGIIVAALFLVRPRTEPGN